LGIALTYPTFEYPVPLSQMMGASNDMIYEKSLMLRGAKCNDCLAVRGNVNNLSGG
jgi:hypothetical protein